MHMKKLFTLLLAIQLITLCSFQVFGSATDAELAELLNQLEWWSWTVSPQAVVPEDTTAAEQHQAAEDILDAMDEDTWAYSWEEKIEVKDVTSTGATIVTTQVTYNGTPVTKYKIYYSDKTLATVEDFEKITDVVVDVDSTEGTNVLLKFEDLTPNKTYYVVVVPVHPTDVTQEPLSFISEEVMFTTKEEIVATAPTQEIQKVFENVSYTYKDSLVTVTWTPSSVAEKTQIELRHQSEAAYTKVWSPLVSAGTFSFTVSKPGTYFLKMSAVNADGTAVGQEHIQTIKIDEVQQPEEVVQAAPKVWPETDLMIAIMLFSVIVYAGVKFRKAHQ